MNAYKITRETSNGVEFVMPIFADNLQHAQELLANYLEMFSHLSGKLSVKEGN